MSVLRGLLFDNLGLKLVALLLSVLVYLNVYTDRPATQIVSFPLQISDLPDSLSLAWGIPNRSVTTFVPESVPTVASTVIPVFGSWRPYGSRLPSVVGIVA